MLFVAYGVVAAGGAALSAVLTLALRAWRSLPRMLLAMMPLGIVAVAARLAQTALNAPNQDWAGARLSPLIGLRFGYHLYYGPTDGPVLNTIYAPLSYLIYAATCLASDAGLAIVIASLIGLLCFFAPAGILLARRGPYGAAAFALFVLLAYQVPSLRMSLEGTTHDCPALGLALAACLPLYFERLRARTLAMSALCAILAVWTKQVTAPLLVALPLWLALTHGRRTALAFLGWLVALGLPISLLLTALIGRDAMLFNILTLPAHHPWNGSFPSNLLIVAYYFYRDAFALGLVLLLVAIVDFRTHSAPWREWLRGRRASLLVLVALLQMPTALLGRVKVGGSANNFSLSTYFLLAAVLVLLVEQARDAERSFDLSRLTLALGAIGFVLLTVPQEAFFFREYAGFRQTREEQVVRYLRQHPGEAYFPWNPLPHLLGEGRLYHFAYGLFDRDLGGFRVNAGHLSRFVPDHCRYVCFPEGRRRHRPSDALEAWLREFPRRVEIPELAGFECYARDQ